VCSFFAFKIDKIEKSFRGCDGVWKFLGFEARLAMRILLSLHVLHANAMFLLIAEGLGNTQIAAPLL
jgi:hypothetical protein